MAGTGGQDSLPDASPKPVHGLSGPVFMHTLLPTWHLPTTRRKASFSSRTRRINPSRRLTLLLTALILISRSVRRLDSS